MADLGTDESELIGVELVGVVDLSRFKHYSILGLNTDRPILKLDDEVFVGTYEDVLGTDLFFQVTPAGQASQVAYAGKSARRLRFEPVRVVPKQQSTTATTSTVPAAAAASTTTTPVSTLSAPTTDPVSAKRKR